MNWVLALKWGKRRQQGANVGHCSLLYVVGVRVVHEPTIGSLAPAEDFQLTSCVTLSCSFSSLGLGFLIHMTGGLP